MRTSEKIWLGGAAAEFLWSGVWFAIGGGWYVLLSLAFGLAYTYLAVSGIIRHRKSKEKLAAELESAMSLMSSLAAQPAPYYFDLEILRTLADVVPGINQIAVKCPDGNELPFSSLWLYPQTLLSIVMHLNDDHRWTREQIADWLETLDYDLTIRPAATRQPMMPELSSKKDSVGPCESAGNDLL